MKKKAVPQWSRLDNTAKIFPPNSTKRDSKVFRYVCELNEPVEPQLLQTALDRTMEQFPLFGSVMKRGLFWYYLEESDCRALVRPETLPPCAPLFSANRRGLLFRVLYYGKRISLEVYHVLADGTGALPFLCTLVYYYLLERYQDDFTEEIPKPYYSASQWVKRDEAFWKYYEKPEMSFPEKEENAYHLRGARNFGGRLGIVEGQMPLQELLQYARERDVTLTELMTAVLLLAIHDGMTKRESARPVVIVVPVNLRGYFPTESTRNFFATINVGYDFGRRQDNMEEVLEHVKGEFRRKLSKEQFQKRMNQLYALEDSLLMRLVPLVIKNIILRAASLMTERKVTASLSNVGKISMPAGMEKYIHLFSVFTSPDMIQASICSFQNDYVVSFAGPFCSHEVERAFFGRLRQLGIAVTVTTNFSPKKQKKEE